MCGAAGNGRTDAVGVITCTAETENWVLEPGFDFLIWVPTPIPKF